MAAVLFRVRIWLRHRIGRTIVAAVLIGLVAGLAMGLVAGTRRTASAPDRYTEWAGGEIDLALTQPQGDPATDSIAELDGVSEALSIAFVPAFPGRSPDDIAFAANPFSGDDHIAGTRVVVGRHTDRARPDEFTVNDEMAAVLTEQYGAQVGDEFQIYAFSKEQLESNRAFSDGEPPGVPAFTATWVGIVETPADFEESLPSLYYSPSFLSAHPTIPAIQTIIQVRLDPGTDPSAVLAEIQQLPDAAGTYPTDGQIVSEESRRAVRFQVTALWIVVGIALTATVFVIVQLVIRMLQAPAADASSMISLGWRRRDIAVERIAEALVAVAMAIPLAILVAWLVSEPFPIGSLDTFEPHPGPILDGLVVAIGSAVLVLAMIAGALLAVRAERTRSDAPARPWRGAGARGSMPLA
ncbi:MAG: ABC transporter permease, partial [Actinobacteria bacterium]|nr:ABC transporter permease [Actinomycetota bacterium]